MLTDGKFKTKETIENIHIGFSLEELILFNQIKYSFHLIFEELEHLFFPLNRINQMRADSGQC